MQFFESHTDGQDPPPPPTFVYTAERVNNRFNTPHSIINCFHLASFVFISEYRLQRKNNCPVFVQWGTDIPFRKNQSNNRHLLYEYLFQVNAPVRREKISLVSQGRYGTKATNARKPLWVLVKIFYIYIYILNHHFIKAK